jgi:hypothetical protein
LAIGDAIIALAYPWTSAQACGFISATILERGITMMMIKPVTGRKALRENIMPLPASSSPSVLRIVDSLR